MTATAEPNRQDAKSQLPDGWRWVKLGEAIVEAQHGFAIGERDPKGVIQLRMNNVTTQGQFDWSSFIRVPADSETIAAYRLQSGDVLFNNTNSTELVGKTALFEKHDEPVVFSNHFTRIRTNAEKIDSRFLALWLQQQWQRGVFASICNRWIGQSAVQREKLLALEIALPPLAEQKRIAGILKEQMAAVERARGSAEAQLQAAESLPAARLRAVFSSPEAQSWPKKRFEDTCEMLGAKPISTAGDVEVRAITTACLSESGFLPSGVKTARMWAGDAKQCVVSKGEVLIARSNTPELVGRAAMFAGEPKGAVASDLTIRLKAREGLLPVFLTAHLAFLYLSGYWKERAGGASGSMKKITRTQIQRELIPVPSDTDQCRIASQLSGQMSSAERLRQTLAEQLDAINKLPAALLREAFSGRV